MNINRTIRMRWHWGKKYLEKCVMGSSWGYPRQDDSELKHKLSLVPRLFPLTSRAWVRGYTTIKQGAQRMNLFWLVCACLTYIIKIIISCYLGLCGRAYSCSCTSSWPLCSSPMLKDYTWPESTCTWSAAVVNKTFASDQLVWSRYA